MFPSAYLANLRRRIPGRRIQRWPKGKERMDDRAAQWRGHSRSFGFAKENDRLTSQGRAGTWFRLLAKSWKSGAVSKHLGQAFMSNQVLPKLWAVLCLLFISCGDDAESVAKRDLSKASPSDSSEASPSSSTGANDEAPNVRETLSSDATVGAAQPPPLSGGSPQDRIQAIFEKSQPGLSRARPFSRGGRKNCCRGVSQLQSA